MLKLYTSHSTASQLPGKKKPQQKKSHCTRALLEAAGPRWSSTALMVPHREAASIASPQSSGDKRLRSEDNAMGS